MRATLWVLCALLFAACSPQPRAVTVDPDPLVFDPAAIDAADNIAILVPGALASVSIFNRAAAWRDSGYALAAYRLPGLDGLPADTGLVLDEAAARIAEFAAAYPDKPIRLLGYSTGAPIALMAASRIDGDVRVAGLSPAVEKAGALGTAWRGAVDVLGAAVTARTVDRERIWIEYYKTLLFGRQGRTDPSLEPTITRLADAQKDRIVVPDSEVVEAHTSDLRTWTIPEGYDVPADRVRFFVGLEDPVFSLRQTRRFAQRLGGVEIRGYPGHGHLPFVTVPSVFDDILAFFEADLPG